MFGRVRKPINIKRMALFENASYPVYSVWMFHDMLGVSSMATLKPLSSELTLFIMLHNFLSGTVMDYGTSLCGTASFFKQFSRSSRYCSRYDII